MREQIQRITVVSADGKNMVVGSTGMALSVILTYMLVTDSADTYYNSLYNIYPIFKTINIGITTVVTLIALTGLEYSLFMIYAYIRRQQFNIYKIENTIRFNSTQYTQVSKKANFEYFVKNEDIKKCKMFNLFNSIEY